MNFRWSSLLRMMTVAVLLPSAATAQEAQPLTIEEALEVSYQNNPTMLQSDFLEKENEMQQKAAYGLYFPRITLNGSYQVMSDEIHLDLNPVKDAIVPLYETLGQYGNFSDVPNPDPATQDQMPVLPQEQSTQAVRSQLMETAGLLNNQEWNKTIQKEQFGTVSANIKWPLYMGGKIKAANKAASLQTKAARQKSRQNKSKLMSELVSRYYALRLAGEVKNIRKDVLDLMEQHFSDAKRLYEEGMIAEAQMLHARVYKVEAERKFKKSKSDYYIANKALHNSLSVDEAGEIIAVSKLFYLKSMKSPGFYIRQAYQENPRLIQVALKKEQAHQLYKVQKSDYLPKAAVAGMYDIYNKDLSPYIPEWIVGVNLQWNLFDGLARSNKVKAAKYMEDRVEQIHVKAKEDISTLVEKLCQQLEMDVEQIDELEASAAYAREYLNVSRRSFQEGMATSKDVTEASLALSKVRIEKLEVMYDYVTTLSRLLEVTGQSDEFKQYQLSENTVFENEINLTENE